MPHDGAAAHLAFGGLAVQGLFQSQHAPRIRAGARERLRQPPETARPVVPEAPQRATVVEGRFCRGRDVVQYLVAAAGRMSPSSWPRSLPA